MTRLQHRLEDLRASGRKALVPFVTAGDPSLAATVPVMHALVEAGADVIELGVPFSDPMADGPVIQRSSERALARGVGLKRVLALFAKRLDGTAILAIGRPLPDSHFFRKILVIVKDAAAPALKPVKVRAGAIDPPPAVTKVRKKSAA